MIGIMKKLLKKDRRGIGVEAGRVNNVQEQEQVQEQVQEQEQVQDFKLHNFLIE